MSSHRSDVETEPCFVCSQDGLTEEEMRSHMIAVHELSEEKCPMCDLSGISPKTMEAHINTKHFDATSPKPKTTECETRIGGTSTNARGGSNRKRKLKCAICRTFAADSKDTLKQHYREQHVQELFALSNSVATPGIDRSRSENNVPTERALAVSLNSKNVDANDGHICPLCQQRFANSSDLQRHVDAHYDDFKCPVCGRRYKTSSALQRHVNEHFDRPATYDYDSPHSEPSSGPEVTRPNGTSVLPDKNSPVRGESLLDKTVFPCPHCDAPLGDSSLEEHIMKDHPELKSDQSSLRCPMCFELANSHVELDVHVNAHFGNTVEDNEAWLRWAEAGTYFDSQHPTRHVHDAIAENTQPVDDSVELNSEAPCSKEETVREDTVQTEAETIQTRAGNVVCDSEHSGGGDVISENSKSDTSNGNVGESKVSADEPKGVLTVGPSLEEQERERRARYAAAYQLQRSGPLSLDEQEQERRKRYAEEYRKRTTAKETANATQNETKSTTAEATQPAVAPPKPKEKPPTRVMTLKDLSPSTGLYGNPHIEDGTTRTAGVLEKLHSFYSRASTRRYLANYWLASPTDHYSGAAYDRGWGCGYRNFQMLLSCLMRDVQYRKVVFNGRFDMPSLLKIQKLIEEAWTCGFDPQGRKQLQGQVVLTRKWIGATEICAVATKLRLRCQLVDFTKPTGHGRTHPRLFEWVKNYFKNATAENERIIPPLYLQHQGHSRTIVGIEELKDKQLELLIFDPGCPRDVLQKMIGRNEVTPQQMRVLRKPLFALTSTQYQIVAVRGILEPGKEENYKLLKSEVMC